MSEIDLDKKVTFESETGQFGGDPDSEMGIGNFCQCIQIFWLNFGLISTSVVYCSVITVRSRYWTLEQSNSLAGKLFFVVCTL